MTNSEEKFPKNRPPQATHCFLDDVHRYSGWLFHDGISWQYCRDREPFQWADIGVDRPRNLILLTDDLSAPQNDESQNVARIEWDGEGLPPVGTVCDVRQITLPHEWNSATVLFVGEQRVFYRMANGEEMSRPIKFLLFRPIRTPEQIAADEREKAAIDMHARFGGIGGLTMKQCIWVISEGYRKL
jgi:hypothetical protein